MRRISGFGLNFKYAFRPHKPRLIARLIRAVMKSSLLGKVPLRYVDFCIGFKCNLRCKHCFAVALESKGRRQMTKEDYKRVARECMELGAVNFSFQGGEPLLSDDLSGIISACCPGSNLISVSTNGTTLSEENLLKLKESGVDILTISLDSSDPAEHDRFRGVSGTFKKTVQGINLALKRGFRVTLGTVVTHETLKSAGIHGLIAMARDLKLLFYFILPAPAGRWINNKSIFLTQEDIDYIQKLTRSSPYLRTDFQANLGGYGCGAVKEILYLTPYGDVLACPFLHISLGNIFEESIRKIRQRALENPYFAVYRDKCLVSTDAEFIDKYLKKTFNAGKLPLLWSEVFTLEAAE